MDAVRKKVLNELFLAPSVVLPIVAGASALILSWGFGGVVLATAGVAGILGGVGWMATRMVFKLDEITARTMAYMNEQQRREENSRLDELAKKLRNDRDYRTKDYLTILRDCRNEMETLAAQPAIQARSIEVLQQVRQLFWAAIDQLEQSYKLFELSERLVSDERKEVLERRDEIVKSVNTSVDRLQSAVDQFRSLAKREQNLDLNELRDELDVSLKVAKRTEERMREIEESTNYERHLKE